MSSDTKGPARHVTWADMNRLVAGGAVRGIGFDNTMYTDGKSTERLFFVGAQGERIEQASEEQVSEFIAYYESQLATARLYLVNKRESETTKWTRT
jgi:hypothetical protein